MPAIPSILLATEVRFRCREPSLSKALNLLDASTTVFVDAVRDLFLLDPIGSQSSGQFGEEKMIVWNENRSRRIRIRYSGNMFARRLSIQRIDSTGQSHPCPIHWIDNFAMRNFTNDAVFDDTLPAADGLLEAGSRVPLDRLQPAMEDWFRRKGYLKPGEKPCGRWR